MALAFVKVTEIVASTGNSANASISSTAGNLFVCPAAAWEGNQTGHTPTASGGGTWTADITGEDTVDASNHYGMSISSAPNITGGTNTTTVATNATINGGLTAFVYEFSGAATASPKDATSPAIATGNGTTATTGNLTSVTANAVFVAINVCDSGANPATETGTSSGWTYPAGGKETDGATNLVVGTGYDIETSVKTNNNSAWTINSSHWGALIAVYKAAAVSASPFAPTDTPAVARRTPVVVDQNLNVIVLSAVSDVLMPQICM